MTEKERLREADHLLDAMYNPVLYFHGVVMGCEYSMEYLYRGDVPTIHAKKQIAGTQNVARGLQMKAKARALISYDRVLNGRELNV